MILVERLRKEFSARQEQLQQVILSDVKDLVTYKYVLGQLHAWKKADQELTNLLKNRS